MEDKETGNKKSVFTTETGEVREGKGKDLFEEACATCTISYRRGSGKEENSHTEAADKEGKEGLRTKAIKMRNSGTPMTIDLVTPNERRFKTQSN